MARRRFPPGRRFVLAVAALLATAAPAAADYRDGVAAWGRGDFAAAARQFLPAAQAGDAESQYMMGRLYSLGDGVPRDFVQAWVWFDRAARQGHGLAREARDAMNHVLNAQQMAEARALDLPPPIQRPPPPPQAPPQTAEQTAEAARQVVLVPRRGVVGVPAARMVAPGPSHEGRLLAADDAPARLRRLQASLKAGGYYGGPLDGTLGPATRAAIRAWQRAHGEPETGTLTAALLDDVGAADQQQAAR